LGPVGVDWGVLYTPPRGGGERRTGEGWRRGRRRRGRLGPNGETTRRPIGWSPAMNRERRARTWTAAGLGETASPRGSRLVQEAYKLVIHVGVGTTEPVGCGEPPLLVGLGPASGHAATQFSLQFHHHQWKMVRLDCSRAHSNDKKKKLRCVSTEQCCACVVSPCVGAE